MATTDTSEKGLESLIVRHLTGQPPVAPPPTHTVQSSIGHYATGGYVQGSPGDYNRDVAVDVVQLLAFLQATQPKKVEALGIDQDGIKRTQILHRLQGEVAKRGVVDVLRKGVSHGPMHLDLYKVLPTPTDPNSVESFSKNFFSVTRQLHYSNDDTQRSLDMAIFINGLPLITFELKNSLTKQTVQDAIVQYQTTRDPRELLFQLGRCMVHLAVDDAEVRFCTHLTGKSSWFLPFNQGWNGGAGNPPNPHGLKTDYLWKRVLAKESLANIIENFAQIVEEEDERGKKKRKQIFPRFHQLRSVRALLRTTREEGVGHKYLIQHSAGSGKSNTIAWLAHQLVELKTATDVSQAQFDSVIVITDRKALDTAIARTIKSYDHVAAIFGHSDSAEELRGFLQQGKKIIVTTVQKFPFVLDELGGMGGKKFALLIDEAHSSQGGKTTAKMHMALSAAAGDDEDDEESVEDAVNRLIESRKMLTNASYFAFTATPKNKTLELFGERYEEGGKAHFRSPADLTYTTKQAIEEGFILDVIKNYTPVDSFYRVAKTVEDDPDFDKVKALKKIRHYVESHEKAIRKKAEIMVDHFMAQVVGKRKIGGQARAMIVCQGIARAVDYYREVSAYLKEIKSPYQAIVAFSGEHDVAGVKKTEADLNGFPSKDIPAKLRQDPYRFLIVANKFVTGFDEPLLHTMYVDKTLAGVQAVQTLSRLNRAHPQKHDTFVMDFADNAEAVRAAFQDYYRATVQIGETDPNKLHDLKADLDGHQVYAWQQVEDLVALFVKGADRDKLDPILDACVEIYKDNLNEDEQIDFKGKAKTFVRSYGFLGAILTYGHPSWERLSIFLNFLIPKLPAPKEEDLAKGVLEAIDMDSYRPEVNAALAMAMDETDGALEPAPTGGGGGLPEPEIDKLSNIIRAFNDLFGNIDWKDADKIRKVIAEDIPARVAQDTAYQNAQQNSDKQNAKMEHDKALNRVVLDLLSDHTELFKQFSDNPNFKRWLTDSVFDATYLAKPPRPGGASTGNASPA
ncbi:MAG: type I restriction endonuclease subunit R [Gammaproteobacteria bacterium]|nr:type I restriction endonuclease subunit R [Gammaproteobacteria bacterium]MBU0786827.1 type I restriction endonuclease subunit R [Gammaproteobacteria bacterium]MBU0813967.1 type I restriction endonuclease subunit R [Gammaproteobacteria bacterium]MBU1788560.1 type I restriction endonuclease subunit R [Gammaproteobacteria bacterium]